MKKLLSLVLVAVLMLSAVLPLGAANEISVIVDGKAVAFDVPPQIVDGRTMVPLRKIGEALGATVNWNAATRTVVSEKDGTKVQLTIDDPKMLVDGVTKTLDVPAMIIDGRTLLPLRAVGEAYGCQVVWNGTTRTVTITSKNEPAKPTYAFEQNADYLEILQLLKTNLADLNPTFEYVEQEGVKFLLIHMDAPDGTAAALQLDAAAMQASWAELVNVMCDLSGNTSDAFAVKGHTVYCSVQLHNDVNADLVLLETLNYDVYYNVMDELLAA